MKKLLLLTLLSLTIAAIDVTTKRVAWKTCLKELLWFIKGDTSNTRLQEQNVRIWNGNASRDFLDSLPDHCQTDTHRG